MWKKTSKPARRMDSEPLKRKRGQQPDRKQAVWLAEEDALLGTMPDLKLARRLGRPAHTVARRRQEKHIWLARKPWRPEDDKILGSRPDSQVARLLGRKLGTVALRRRQLGIRCFYQHRPWLEHELEMLGVKSDAEVASLTGHPLSAV